MLKKLLYSDRIDSRVKGVVELMLQAGRAERGRVMESITRRVYGVLYRALKN